MLPLNRRIKKESFEKIMKEGVFVHSTSFYLRVWNRKDSLPSLFSFVVPIKVKKKSVGRHLFRRKMSAAVESVLLDLKVGFSVIFFAKKDFSTLPLLEMKKEILELLVKAGILKLN
jgi:ribonuclease P protein component